MIAEEIRKLNDNVAGTEKWFLCEIAAQLAELNSKLKDIHSKSMFDQVFGK